MDDSRRASALHELGEELLRLGELGQAPDPDALAARFGLEPGDVRRCQAALGALGELGLSASRPAKPPAKGPASTASSPGLADPRAVTAPLPEGEDEPAPAPAKALEERYELGEEIARGGMGVIRAVFDRALRRELALKLLDQRRVGARQAVRFVEEAQIQGQLEHPNICPVHELGQDAQGRPWFTMKRVRGRSLAQVLEALERHDAQARSEWPLPRLLDVFTRVCDGVAFAHARGVIHRDLKPENVMVGEFGEVLVMDWGLAKLRGQPEPETKRTAEEGAAGPVTSDRALQGAALTEPGTVMGTPQYMPPEQARGEPVDERTDVWALGGILYAILTGQPPLHGETLRQVLGNAAAGRVRPPSQRRPGVPPALEAACLKALAPAPTARYASAAALKADVQAFLDGRAVSAVRYGLLDLLGLWVRRNLALAAVSGAAALLLLLGGTVFLVGLAQARRAAEDAASQATREATRAGEAEQRARDEAARATRALADLEAATAREREAAGAQRQAETRAAASAARAEEAARNQAREETGKLLARGDAACAAQRWSEARQAYEQARQRLVGAGASPAPAELGLWDVARGAPPPLLDLEGLWGDGSQPEYVRPPVAASQDGRWALAPAAGKGFHLFDLVAGQVARSFAPADDFVPSACALSRDGRRAAWGDAHGRVTLAELPGGEVAPLQSASPMGGLTVTALAFSPDGARLLATFGFSGGVRVWDLAAPERPLTPTVARPRAKPPRDMTCVAWSGPSFLAGDEGGALQRWDAGGTLLARLEAHRGPVRGLAGLGPDRAASGGDDGVVRVWDLEAGTALRTLEAGAPVLALAASPDGTRLLAGTGDGALLLWDVATGALLLRRDGAHAHAVSGCAFAGDELLVSAGADRRLRVWSAGEPWGRRTWAGHTGPVSALAASPDGRLLVSGGEDGAVRLWDVATRQRLLELGRHEGGVRGLGFSADGRYLVSAGAQGEVVLWDPRRGERLRAAQLPLRGGAERGRGQAVFLPGRLQALVSLGERARQVDLAQGAVEADDLGSDPDPGRFGLLPDGRALGPHGELWTPGRRERTPGRREASPGPVAASPDGRQGATARGELIEVWDLTRPPPRQGDEPAPVHELRAGPGEVLALTFLPPASQGGACWLLAQQTEGLALIDPREGATLRWFPERALLLAPVGGGAPRFASGDRDGRLAVWDLGSGPPEESLAARYTRAGRWAAAAELLARSGGDPLLLARCRWQAGDPAGAAEALARVPAEREEGWYLELCRRALAGR